MTAVTALPSRLAAWRRLVPLAVGLGLCACAPARPAAVPSGGQPVQGATRLYELTPPGPGWQPAAEAAQRNADLGLIGPGSCIVVVWVKAPGDSSLEDVVFARRQALIDRGARALSERRYFLAEGDLVPASRARYEMSDHVVQTLTVASGRGIIEIIASADANQEQTIDALLGSLRLLE